MVITNYSVSRVRYFRERVSNFNQSEARKQCFFASDWYITFMFIVVSIISLLTVIVVFQKLNKAGSEI